MLPGNLVHTPPECFTHRADAAVERSRQRDAEYAEAHGTLKKGYEAARELQQNLCQP